MMTTGARIEQPDEAIRVPELGRLKEASERIAMARDRVGRFLDRFNGPQVSDKVGGAEVSPPSHYRNDINTLFRQLERLENVVSSLDEIG